MKSIKKIALNRTNLAYALVIIMMLSTIHIIAPITSELNIIVLLWGGILFLYDIFNNKRCLKSRYSKFLILYMIFFLCSIIFNIRENVIGNIKTFAYTGLYLFIIYAYEEKKSQEAMEKELYNFNTIIITISSIVSFASILTFIFFIQFTVKGIPQGFVYPKSPALWGFYGNPNNGGMVAVISIIVTLFNIYLCKYAKLNDYGNVKRAYYYTNIIIQWLYLVLCNSRGAVIALLGFVLVATFYGLYNKFNERDNGVKITSLVLVFLLTGVMFFAYNFTVKVSKKGLSYIPKTINHLMKMNSDKNGMPADEDFGLVELDREIKDGHVSTGRVEIWTYGLNTLKLSPLVGHGPDNLGLAKRKIYPNDTSKYMVTNNMHNGYLQILLSNGILGFLAFGIFFTLMVKDSLIFFFNKKISYLKNQKMVVLFILSVVVSVAVNGMFENVILLTQSYMTAILWLYLGYASFNFDKVKEMNNKKELK